MANEPPFDSPEPIATDDRPSFVIYELADGDLIFGEYQWVTDLDFFDEREEEVRLIKRTYRLVAEEEVVLPDPFPIGGDGR